MKHLCKLFAVVVLVLSMAACGGKSRFENDLFSVEVPDGYKAGEIESEVTVIPSAQLVAEDDNSSIFILAFPFEGDPEKVLLNQTFGGANPALADMNYPSMPSSFTFGKINGFQVPMTGEIQEIYVEGVAYCFELDSCTFFVYSLSRDGESLEELDRGVIESIKVNADVIAKYDGKRRIDTVVEMASFNLPMPVDELTTWENVTVNHPSKEVIMTMALQGSAEDYGNAQELLDTMRDDMAVNLRTNRDTDWLIRVPSDEGYSLVYQYVVGPDHTPIAKIRIDSDELK